jgi:hypothetical protein
MRDIAPPEGERKPDVSAAAAAQRAGMKFSICLRYEIKDITPPEGES